MVSTQAPVQSQQEYHEPTLEEQDAAVAYLEAQLGPERANECIRQLGVIGRLIEQVTARLAAEAAQTTARQLQQQSARHDPSPREKGLTKGSHS